MARQRGRGGVGPCGRRRLGRGEPGGLGKRATTATNIGRGTHPLRAVIHSTQPITSVFTLHPEGAFLRAFPRLRLPIHFPAGACRKEDG